jgi:mRNA interferase MazF
LSTTRNPAAGEIWDVDFDPRIGHEQGGIRPALVISIDRFNRIPHDLRIVVPITGTDRGLPHHVKVAPPEGGLTKPSLIMCEQVKSQSLLRFKRKRGTINPDSLDRVQHLVGIFIAARGVVP